MVKDRRGRLSGDHGSLGRQSRVAVEGRTVTKQSRRLPPKYWYFAAFTGVLAVLDIAWGLAIHHLTIIFVGVLLALMSIYEWFRARKAA
jgi:hypothetical protein